MPTVVTGEVRVLTMSVDDPDHVADLLPLRPMAGGARRCRRSADPLAGRSRLRRGDRRAERTRWLVRFAFAGAAILLPVAYFLSVLSPDANAPNALVALACIGAVITVAGMVILGVGLVRARSGVDEGLGTLR